MRTPLEVTPGQMRKIQDLATQCGTTMDDSFNKGEFLAGVAKIVGKDLKAGHYELKVQWRRPRMPELYRPSPMGPMPLYWGDDRTGELPAAIKRYLAWAASDRPLDPPAGEDFELIREYLIYHIKAPCWVNVDAGQDPEMADEIRKLYAKAEAIEKPEDIRDYIEACLHLGLDPL